MSSIKEELEAQFDRMPTYLMGGSRVFETHVEMDNLMRLFFKYLENKFEENEMKNNYQSELSELRLGYYKEYFARKQEYSEFLDSLFSEMKDFVNLHTSLKILESKLDVLNSKLLSESSENECEECDE